MKIDWKIKLTSRKLWIAVAGFVTGLILAFNGSAMTNLHTVAVAKVYKIMK